MVKLAAKPKRFGLILNGATVLAAVLAGHFAAYGDQATSPLALIAGGHWGHLSVVNTSSATLLLHPAIVVEGFSGGQWRPVVTEMSLVSVCAADGAVRPVSDPIALPAHATLRTPPWRGWSCNGQCERHCRSNLYWGTGPFRFRVSISPSGRSFVSSAFAMPSEPTQPDDAL